jgi:hypothetical protein
VNTLKEWECVEVGHHDRIGKTIEEWQEKGWQLYSYQAAGRDRINVSHYLLFERGT